MPRIVSLLGLGFGDCGKGLFTDALCRRWQAHTVVRFNGGAQAGHNVVLPDGRQHTFAQFSAGTLVPGVATVLAHPVVVHPGALAFEHAHLQSIGVHDGAERLLIDPRCRVNTPFHQAAGRLRELARGAAVHGTCGIGVGETVRHALASPEHVLYYGDLARPALAMQKLQAIRDDLWREFAAIRDATLHEPLRAAEARLLGDDKTAEIWLARAHSVWRIFPSASPARIGERLERSGTVLFEGAQGILLDEWHGFHPHTTWSSIHPRAVEAVVADYGGNGQSGQIEHLGVLRAYLTRHGAGPFPTADSTLDHVSEPHNSDQGWQGPFRRGQPDGVLVRYAREIAGRLDGLLVSHLDVFRRLPCLRWCAAYDTRRLADADLPAGLSSSGGRVHRLPRGSGEDLVHQSALTRLLFAARPLYDARPLTSSGPLLERFADAAGCPVWFSSAGPDHTTVRALKPRRCVDG